MVFTAFPNRDHRLTQTGFGQVTRGARAVWRVSSQVVEYERVNCEIEREIEREDVASEVEREQRQTRHEVAGVSA